MCPPVFGCGWPTGWAYNGPAELGGCDLGGVGGGDRPRGGACLRARSRQVHTNALGAGVPAKTPEKRQTDQAPPPLCGAVRLSGRSADPLPHELCRRSRLLGACEGLHSRPDDLHTGLGVSSRGSGTRALPFRAAVPRRKTHLERHHCRVGVCGAECADGDSRVSELTRGVNQGAHWRAAAPQRLGLSRQLLEQLRPIA